MLNRRDFLCGSGAGFGGIALTALLADDGLLAAENKAPPAEPLAPKKPHFEAKAKRVIFLFMSGGPSHLETFDPKPDLQRLHGEKLPESFGPVKTRRGVDKNRLRKSSLTTEVLISAEVNRLPLSTMKPPCLFSGFE